MSFLGPGSPGHTALDMRTHSYTPTHSLTHTGSSSPTLQLKKASFQVELTSQRGEGGVSILEGFPVDGPGTIFFVFLLGDPHLLEGVQGSKDRASGVEKTQRSSVRETVQPANPSGPFLKGQGRRVEWSELSLPILYLFHGLLTQSTWNTVSPGVPISAEGDGKRNLRHPTLLFLFCMCVCSQAYESMGVRAREHAEAQCSHLVSSSIALTTEARGSG